MLGILLAIFNLPDHVHNAIEWHEIWSSWIYPLISQASLPPGFWRGAFFLLGVALVVSDFIPTRRRLAHDHLQQARVDVPASPPGDEPEITVECGVAFMSVMRTDEGIDRTPRRKWQRVDGEVSVNESGQNAAVVHNIGFTLSFFSMKDQSRILGPVDGAWLVKTDDEEDGAVEYLNANPVTIAPGSEREFLIAQRFGNESAIYAIGAESVGWFEWKNPNLRFDSSGEVRVELQLTSGGVAMNRKPVQIVFSADLKDLRIIEKLPDDTDRLRQLEQRLREFQIRQWDALTDNAARELFERLSPIGPQTAILTHQANPDCGILAKSLMGVFERAGWTVRNAGSGTWESTDVQGLKVYHRDDASAASIAAAIGETLGVQVQAQPRKWASLGNVNCDAFIVVGAKRPEDMGILL